jgi:hypothetical protein
MYTQYTGKKTFSKKRSESVQNKYIDTAINGILNARLKAGPAYTMKEVQANGSIENEFWR